MGQIDPGSKVTVINLPNTASEKLVCPVGIEPTTYRLRGGRSTTELRARCTHENGSLGPIRTDIVRRNRPVHYQLCYQEVKEFLGWGLEPHILHAWSALPLDHR